MIVSLLDGDLRSETVSERCDVCIVGAGAAGSFLANALARRGCEVVVVEAGPETAADTLDAGFEPSFVNRYYAGGVEGRAFGLGGSTSRWGGLLVPHSVHDLRPVGRDEAIWTHIVDVVRDRRDAVLGALGFEGAPGFERFAAEAIPEQAEALERAGLAVLTSLYLPVRRKNLSFLLRAAAIGSPPARVYYDAVAKHWSVDDSGRIRSLRATTHGERRLEVSADHFVIASGALESARILLEIAAAAPESVALSADLGVGLGDHLSIPIAEVAHAARAAAIRAFAPRFAGAWMRSFRFLNAETGEDEPRSFSHFVFAAEDAGYELIRRLVGAVQSRRLPDVTPSQLVRGLAGAGAIAFDRFARSRLHVSRSTAIRLQLDVEQGWSEGNRITLGTELDEHGRPVARIDWQIAPGDEDSIRRASERLLEGWASQGQRLPALEPATLDFESTKPHDAYHPVGVCRMGTDRAAVLSPALRVHGLANAWTLSTAALPSAGTANPTFTMLCLGAALADELAPG